MNEMEVDILKNRIKILRARAGEMDGTKIIPVSGILWGEILKELSDLLEQKIPMEPELAPEKDFWICPKCGTEVYKNDHHCKCSQTLIWKE